MSDPEAAGDARRDGQQADHDQVRDIRKDADLDVRHFGRGVFQVISQTHTTLAYAVVTGAATWVFVDGHVYVIDAGSREGPARQPQHLDDVALAAPMPATVLALNVVPGQQVARGDVMIVLEAMKMELQITAPRDARVKSVACRQGDLVQPGVPLVELE